MWKLIASFHYRYLKELSIEHEFITTKRLSVWLNCNTKTINRFQIVSWDRNMSPSNSQYCQRGALLKAWRPHGWNPVSLKFPVNKKDVFETCHPRCCKQQLLSDAAITFDHCNKKLFSWRVCELEWTTLLRVGVAYCHSHPVQSGHFHAYRLLGDELKWIVQKRPGTNTHALTHSRKQIGKLVRCISIIQRESELWSSYHTSAHQYCTHTKNNDLRPSKDFCLSDVILFSSTILKMKRIKDKWIQSLCCHSVDAVPRESKLRTHFITA